MTLKEIIKVIIGSALIQPEIQMVVRNDVYRLNDCPSTRYGAFAYTQGTHRASVDGDYRDYSFTLFYVDRLMQDGKNEEEIQSAGVEALDSILTRINEVDGLEVLDYSLTPFTQKFTDYCAGTYAQVTIRGFKTTVCPHYFADYNEDYNKDYLIY